MVNSNYYAMVSPERCLMETTHRGGVFPALWAAWGRCGFPRAPPGPAAPVRGLTPLAGSPGPALHTGEPRGCPFGVTK